MRSCRWTTGVLLTMMLAAGAVPALAAQEPAGVRQTERGVLFDFQDADLRLVLSALAELGRLNLTYGDLPSRRVTLRTNEPVARQNILPLLRSLAASNGLRVVEADGFLRIEPVEPGAPGAGAPRTSAESVAAVEPRLYVHRLRHARATRLAGTLQAIFGGGTGVTGAASGLRSRPLSERLREQQLPPTRPDQGPEVRVDVAPVQSPAASLPGRLRGDVQIVPDEATNSLLILAQPADWEVIRQAVASLDLRPLQVLIEVLIAEVRRSSELSIGVSGRAGSDSGITRTGVSAELRGTGDFALRIMRLGSVDFDVALSAVASGGTVRVLSRPVILAQNNQEARILIGSERPFVQVFRSLPTDAAVRDQVVQYRDVGTALTIIPTINDDGYVNLQVSQEVSTATAETQFGAPVISTREASTHLFVRDGQTVVIGGLVDQQRDRTRSGIPLLRDLPVLGALFGTTREFDSQSELFLFLTPRIIATDEAADSVREGIERGAELLRPNLPAPPLVAPRPDTIPRDTVSVRDPVPPRPRP